MYTFVFIAPTSGFGTPSAFGTAAPPGGLFGNTSTSTTGGGLFGGGGTGTGFGGNTGFCKFLNFFQRISFQRLVFSLAQQRHTHIALKLAKTLIRVIQLALGFWVLHRGNILLPLHWTKTKVGPYLLRSDNPENWFSLKAAQIILFNSRVVEFSVQEQV